jgi:predicted transposase YbfD/YdcC
MAQILSAILMSDSFSVSSSLQTHFADLEDPRVQGRCAHKLFDIVVIALLAVLSGAEGWDAMETYGKGKQTWLATFLSLPNGIPSHDTFRRVLSRLDPSQLEARFQNWIASLLEPLDATVVAIDGKTLRGSYDRGHRLKALQLVSAWCTEHRLVLGQTPVDSKSNEITAIPVLLEQLDLTGAIVTMDAMGTQRAIAQQIRQAKADYILALKGNQGSLYATAQAFFEEFQKQQGHDELMVDHCHQVESGHHRIERRSCWVFRASDIFPASVCQHWPGLKSVVVVHSQRQLWNKTTCETRFFLSSLAVDAADFAHYIRSHWQVENVLHWSLDVVFAEDSSRIRSQHGPRNLSILRRLALNLLRQHPGRGSLKMKRYRASLDEQFLLEILGASLSPSLSHYPS